MAILDLIDLLMTVNAKQFSNNKIIKKIKKLISNLFVNIEIVLNIYIVSYIIYQWLEWAFKFWLKINFFAYYSEFKIWSSNLNFVLKNFLFT